MVFKIKYIIPATKGVSSLRQLAQYSLLEIVQESSAKDEQDIRAARNYLQALPTTLRVQLARDAEELIRDKYPYLDPCPGKVVEWPEDIYFPSHCRFKFYIWRIACFLPDVEQSHLDLSHVGFQHYSAEILRYLSSDACDNLQIRNSCLVMKAGWHYMSYMPTWKGYEALFEKALFRCTNLTDVTLGTLIGDSSIEAVGKWCKRLRRLTLSEQHSVKNEGFIAFAKSQRENRCLREIRLLCNESAITLEGLAQVWLLPLHITRLQCEACNFDTIDRSDYLGEECEIDDYIKAPNGPSKIADMVINWSGAYDNVRKVLAHSKLLFPDLQSLHWRNPPTKLLKSNQTWQEVKSLCCDWPDSDVRVQKLSECFPNVMTLRLVPSLPRSAAGKLQPLGQV